MKKPMITEEQARAIEERKRTNLLDLSIIHHVNGKWKGATNYVLNDLTLDEFIRALYIGYEIEPEFKKGDYITFSGVGTYKIMYKSVDLVHARLPTTDNSVAFTYERLNRHDVRHATHEEVRVYNQVKFWNDNGREVGEFKKNDILSVEGANYAYTISKVLVGKSNNKLYKIDEDSARYTKEMLLKDFVVTCFAHDRKDIKND